MKIIIYYINYIFEYTINSVNVINNKIVIKLIKFINSEYEIRANINYQIYKIFDSLLIRSLINIFFIESC